MLPVRPGLPATCTVCGQALTALQAHGGMLCGNWRCRARRRAEASGAFQARMAEALQAPACHTARVVQVPGGETRLGPVPPRSSTPPCENISTVWYTGWRANRVEPPRLQRLQPTPRTSRGRPMSAAPAEDTAADWLATNTPSSMRPRWAGCWRPTPSSMPMRCQSCTWPTFLHNMSRTPAPFTVRPAAPSRARCAPTCATAMRATA